MLIYIIYIVVGCGVAFMHNEIWGLGLRERVVTANMLDASIAAVLSVFIDRGFFRD
ncbi:MAG: hypothetical protein P4N41_11360 [Negativicutes bacterium]|nr:hypothetical protein [Negativicutes bacterium]